MGEKGYIKLWKNPVDFSTALHPVEYDKIKTSGFFLKS
jgi:hypothetical protein